MTSIFTPLLWLASAPVALAVVSFFRDKELRARIRRAKEEQGDPPAGNGRSPREYHDPIEDDPVFRDTIQRVKVEVEAEIREAFFQGQVETSGSAIPYLPRGTCHRIWNGTKIRLREQHQIVWYSPADLNQIKFD